MIAITFALPAESSDLLNQIRNRTERTRNGIATIHGYVADKEIELFHTGVGEGICRTRIQSFLKDARFDLLISSGFAGAVRDLQVGDLILSSNFSDQRLLNLAQEILKTQAPHVVRLVTAKKIVGSTAAREEIARTSGAAAVDMETEIIAEACAAHGTPLLSLRVISDTPRTPLPAPPDVLFDVQSQRTNFPRLAAYLLAHPTALGRLFRFSAQIRRARRSLASSLVAVLRSDLRL